MHFNGSSDSRLLNANHILKVCECWKFYCLILTSKSKNCSRTSKEKRFILSFNLRHTTEKPHGILCVAFNKVLHRIFYKFLCSHNDILSQLSLSLSLNVTLDGAVRSSEIHKHIMALFPTLLVIKHFKCTFGCINMIPLIYEYKKQKQVKLQTVRFRSVSTVTVKSTFLLVLLSVQSENF